MRAEEQAARRRTHYQTRQHHRPPARVVRDGAEEQERQQQNGDVDREQQGEGGRGEPELGLVDPVEGRHRRIRCKHEERDRGRGPERHARRKCWASRQRFYNSVAGGGHQLRRHPSVDDREPSDLESAAWTSIASIVARHW